MASNFLTRVPPLFADLAKIIAGEIDCSVTTLQAYSSDGSAYQVPPQAVLYPKNVTDIKHILGFAREYTIPVTIRGSGSARSGGALGEGVILDMTRHFNHIRNITMMDNTITVDAGTKVGELLEKLHGWHFDIPFFTGIDKSSTVGAVVATKSSSSSSFHHGTIREWVEGLTVVVDNGEEHTIADGITPSGRLLGIYQEVLPLLAKEAPILRAAKPKSHDDATGYNLWNTSIGPRQLIDQLTGSEGTLAIITSITFRISPLKPHFLTTCIPVAKKELLASYIEIAKHHKAENIFLYDETFMQLSERYYPSLVPSFAHTPYVLLVTHRGNDKESLSHTIRTLHRALPLEQNELRVLEDRKTFEKITDSNFLFSLYTLYTNNTLMPIPTGNGCIVSLHRLSSYLTALETYLNSLGKLYTLTGHVGSGGVSITTLFDPLSRLYDDEVLSYAKNIFSITKEHGGGISATGGEGLMRTPFISYVYNDATLSVFKKIKNIWDPLAILNPGKKIHVTTHYLQQHHKRTVS